MFEEQPPKKVKKEVQVKKEMQCFRCDYPIKKNAWGVPTVADGRRRSQALKMPLFWPKPPF